MRFQPEDEVTLRRITDLAVAPDGHAVVYSVSEVDLLNNRRTTRLWCCVTDSGPERPLTTGGSSERYVSWSPDGEWIAFASAGEGGDHLMIVPSAGGRPRVLIGPGDGFVPTHIDGLRPGGAPGFAWSPNARTLACQLRAGEAVPGELSVEGPRMHGDPMVATEIVQRLRGGPAVQLAVLDVANGSRRTIGHADRPLAHIAWARDGASVYAVSQAEIRPAGTMCFRLLRFPLDRAAPVVVTEFVGADFAPTLSPDGRQFAVSAARGTSNAPSPCLLLLAADGGAKRDVSADDLTTYSDIGWLADGKRIVAVADAGLHRRLVICDTESGRLTSRESGDPLIEMARTSADGTRIAFSGSAPDDPGDVYVLPTTTVGGAGRLTNINPHRETIAWGAGRPITWRAEDGATIEGLLILPPDFKPGTPAPLIVDYHGGPASHVTRGWRGLRQVFAAEGYAVFAPNFRGSTGYGSAASEALRGDIGGRPFTDCMSGVDYLIAERIADPDRLFAYGESWGGYMANWTATQTDRFRAIVSAASISDLLSVFHTRYSSEVWEWRLRGTPDETLEQYVRWSPIRYANRVRVPVLFVSGAEDRTTPPTQALEMFTALRLHGIAAELVVYPREGHGPTEPAHQVDRMKRMLDWFARAPAAPR